MKNIILFLQFITIYIVYHLSLFPSVPGGDSGELLAESCIMGTAHPPGYPLYTIMSKIVSIIPSYRFYMKCNDDIIDYKNDKNIYGNLYIDIKPNIAWKVNHFCCILGALASILLSATVINIYNIIEIRRSKLSSSYIILSSSLASFLYSFSPLIWEYSITAEVFALNNFCCSILLFLTVKIFLYIQLNKINNDEKMKKSIVNLLLLGAFFSGISLSNQHASLLNLVILIPFILLLTSSNSLINIKNFILSGLSFILGLMPYTYLYFASLKPSMGSWGDLTTLSGILKHILR
jgi:hypothetical protein